MVELSGTERTDDLIEAGADPRDLGRGDPRHSYQCGDEVVNGTGGHTGGAGLHHTAYNA